MLSVLLYQISLTIIYSLGYYISIWILRGIRFEYPPHYLDRNLNENVVEFNAQNIIVNLLKSIKRYSVRSTEWILVHTI